MFKNPGVTVVCSAGSLSSLTLQHLSMEQISCERIDFLQENGLLVNMKHRRLMDMTSNLQIQGTISHVVSLSLQQLDTEYDAVLVEFTTVV